MRIQRTYYEVMGLPRDANAQQVKAKYHELARQFHPDRAKDKAVAERLFVQINLAYRTLADPDKRAVYDAGLFQADAAVKRQSGTAAPVQQSSAAPQAPPRPAAPAAASAAAPRQQVNVTEAMARANAAYMGGDRITTHKLCIEVLRVDPNNAEAHALLGDVYADQGRRPDALAEYRTAQKAGDARASLQAKIKRMESLVGSPGQTSTTGGSSFPGSRPPSTPPANGSPRPQQPPQSDVKKGGGFLDRFIPRKN